MAALSPIMSIMIKAAEKAARSLNRDFGEVEQLQVSRKGPADFVTAADKRAEAIIHEELKKARPGFSFLMEEGGEIKGTDGENRWIIDPLDGTHNFMHGLPHWSISIALETRGEIMAGIVYDPVMDEMFRAERGTSAFMNNKRLRVSNRNQLEMCSVAVGNPGTDKTYMERYFKEVAAISAVSPMIRRMASAALDLSYVAAGRLDAYVERNVKPWDVAAGYLIVKEAGGFCTSIDNNDNPVFSGQIIAGNQSVHQDIRKLVKGAA
jgi:myo-inositol-1(or 4)-monophosphatase